MDQKQEAALQAKFNKFKYESLLGVFIGYAA